LPNIRLRHTMKCELGKERGRRVGFLSEGIWTSYIPPIHTSSIELTHVLTRCKYVLTNSKNFKSFFCDVFQI
jgi:hypothetical protein